MAWWGAGVRRGGVATATLLLATALGGCQVFFGVDEPPPPATASSTGSGGGGGAPPVPSAGGSGGRPPLDGCLPAETRPAGTGLCRARALTKLGDADGSKKAPGASCQGNTCYVYFERDADDALMCAACTDLAANECSPATTAGISGINPYLRKLVGELWIAGPGMGTDSDIFFAPLPQPCQAGTPIDVGAPVNTDNSETYPAISPDGKLLFFTRCAMGQCRLHAAFRDDPSGPFTDVAPVGGIRKGVGNYANDIRAVPHWIGLDHDLDAIWFSSQRRHPGGAGIDTDDHDIFEARRTAGAAWDAAFDAPVFVAELSGPVFDAAPVPIRDDLWLGSWLTEPNGITRLYALEVGCGRRFQEPDADPYLMLSTAASDETAPMVAIDGRLLFARGAPGGTSQLIAATPAGTDYGPGQPLADPDVAHVMTASDTDPFLLEDGRLLFASDRDGAFQLWITAEGGPTRVFGSAGWERHPFVDPAGDLWFTWGGGVDPAGTLARAARNGRGWDTPIEVTVGHVEGRSDSAPRLSADRLRLLFTSAREGGFFPGATTPWMAIRSDAAGDWQPPFALTELASVGGTIDAWLAPDGCSITAAVLWRHPKTADYTRDLRKFEF